MRRRNSIGNQFWIAIRYLRFSTLLGIALFVLAFYTFEWNETQLDLAYLVRQSIDITNVQNPTAGNNQLI